MTLAGLLAVAAAPARRARRSRRCRRRTSTALAARSQAVIRGSRSGDRSGSTRAPPDVGHRAAIGGHRRPTSGLAPFPRDGTAFLVLSTGDATQADQPDQPGRVPELRRRRRPHPRARVEARSTRPSCRSRSTARRRGGSVPALPVLRLPLPVGGVPVAARQPLQRRVHRRARQLARGRRRAPRISAPDNFAALPERPAGDDQVDGLGDDVARRGGRHAVRRRHRAAARAGLVPPAGTPTRITLFLSLFDHGDRTLDSAVFIDNLALDAARRAPAPAGVTVPRPGRRDHRADRRRHRRHADADAHRHGATGPGARDGADLPGTAGGRAARADAAGGALGQYVVAPRGAAGPGPVHRAGHAGQRPGINGVSAPTTFTVVARSRSRSRAGARASSRPPATATATGSPTTRTRRTARCRRSPARRSTRA